MSTQTMASSFADMADLEAFKRCKKDGHSDKYCFQFGDNGMGAWGDFTATEKVAMCALPPEDWRGRWGSALAAHWRKVIVIHEGRAVICRLADTMPHKVNIKNGCGIDLNPGAAKALGLKPPFKVPVTWEWAEDAPHEGWFTTMIKRLKALMKKA